MDAQTAAYILFQKGTKQNAIAKILKVSERSISSWAKDGDWESKRVEENLFKETAASKVRKLINHNLEVLALIADKQQVGLDSSLDVAELQKRLIGKGEADGLAKLYAQIKGTEAEWDILVNNMTGFMEYLERENIKLAEKVFEYSNEYMNTKRKQA